MSDADKAYAKAQELIARARAENATSLNLDQPDTLALTTLPPEIADLAHLEILDLNATGVSDVTALRGLTSLTALYLSNTAVSDVTALGRLTSLTALYLSNTAVSDVTALGRLTSLTDLYLSNTAVSDVTALGRLTSLTELNLNATGVSDVTALGGLTSLTELYLNATGVSDVTALGGLTSLTELDINATGVSDVTALGGLTSLTDLYLSNTAVSDVTALGRLTSLTELNLNATGVSDVTALGGLTSLTTLYLDNTGVSDVTALGGLTSLKRLSLSNTGVSDLAALEKLGNLDLLGISGLKVADISTLQHLRKLEDLYLNASEVLDLRPLADLDQLANERSGFGLVFADTPATRADPELQRLAKMEGEKDRADQTRAYLKTLPPWPEPLPSPPYPAQSDPEPDGLVSVGIQDGRFSSNITPPEEEQLKKVLHERLKERGKTLSQQAGNQFYRLATRSRALEQHIDKPYEELDLLMVHLAVEDLRKMEDLGREDEYSGDFPPEVQIALSDVLSIGPGLTLGDDMVDDLVERANRRRTSPPVPQGELRAHDALSEEIGDKEDVADDGLRELENVVRGSDIAEHREVQKASHRSLLWKIGAVSAAGAVGGAVADDVAVQLFSEPIVGFIKASASSLKDAAATYGPQFFDWFIRSVRKLDEFADFF